MHDIFFWEGGMDFNNKFPGEEDFEKTQFKKCQNTYPCLPPPPFLGRTLINAFICLPTQTPF